VSCLSFAFPGSYGLPADVLGITRKFMGVHVVRHYYVKRQFDEATQVALGFLQFLRSECEASLPADFLAQLDAAIAVSTSQHTHAMCRTSLSRVSLGADAWSAWACLRLL
jgi:hypothetical protein